MKNLSLLGIVSFILVLVGGINWLLVGLFELNLVAIIFGNTSLLARLIYILVGLGAAYLIYLWVTKKL